MKNLILTIFITALYSNLFSQVQIGSDIDGEADNDYSGYEISLSADGRTIAIGAPQNDGPSSLTTADYGHVRLYMLDATDNWVQKGQDIDGADGGDWFGWSTALSDDGNTLVFGGLYSNANGGASGLTQVYTFNGTSWVQKGNDIPGEAAFDYAGHAVSISADGNTIAIGASHNDGPNASLQDCGHVRVYTFDGVSSWIQKGIDIDGEAAGDHSGWSVSLSDDGNTLAIGAKDNDGNGAEAGHTRIYFFNGLNWIQKGNDIDGQNAGDWCGWSVSLSDDGNTVVIGERFNSDLSYQSGQARVFQWSGSSWIQLGQDLNGGTIVDWFGHSVAIAGATATTIAVGALRSDGTGGDAGSVSVFDFDGTQWNQTGMTIEAESAGDWFGYSVSLSDDGLTVAGSGINNNVGGTSPYKGHVKVYSMDTGCPADFAGANKLTGTEASIADYETDGLIESIQTIDPGAWVDYDSATAIELQMGFCVNANAVFHAFIDGCEGNY